MRLFDFDRAIFNLDFLYLIFKIGLFFVILWQLKKKRDFGCLESGGRFPCRDPTLRPRSRPKRLLFDPEPALSVRPLRGYARAARVHACVSKNLRWSLKINISVTLQLNSILLFQINSPGSYNIKAEFQLNRLNFD
jgi:hypothetical protein